MATSRTRRNRRQKRAAAALVAAAAATGLAVGTTVQAPAAEAKLPLATASCDPGGADEGLVDLATADCTEASDSVIAGLLDAVAGALAPDFPLQLSALNSANVYITGDATIKGSGLGSAIVVAFGNAEAVTQNPLSGALAIAGGGDAKADSNLGMAVAVTVFGGSAEATALPLGVPIVLSGGEYNGKATALGGFTMASLLSDPNVVCTALYGTAQLTTDGEGARCTSVLFIFQESQTGDGPVVYSIKNPFSLGFLSPLGLDWDIDSLGTDPANQAIKPLASLLAGQFVPYFSQDLLRVTMGDGGPEFESDLFGTPAGQPVAQTASLAGPVDTGAGGDSDGSGDRIAPDTGEFESLGNDDGGAGNGDGDSGSDLTEEPDVQVIGPDDGSGPDGSGPGDQQPTGSEGTGDEADDEQSDTPQPEVESISTGTGNDADVEVDEQ